MASSELFAKDLPSWGETFLFGHSYRSTLTIQTHNGYRPIPPTGELRLEGTYDLGRLGDDLSGGVIEPVFH